MSRFSNMVSRLGFYMKLNEIDLNQKVKGTIHLNYQKRERCYFWVSSLIRYINNNDSSKLWYVDQPRVVDPDGWGEVCMTISQAYHDDRDIKHYNDFEVTLEDVDIFMNQCKSKINSDVINQFMSFLKEKNINK